jgi:hypothetical protein
MQETSAVTCPLPGLENVVVRYNMMASEEQFESWATSMGVQNADAVIDSVENWPADKGEPFSRHGPFAFRLWACKSGLELAMQGFLASFQTSTPSMLSTVPTNGGGSSRRRKSMPT